MKTQFSAHWAFVLTVCLVLSPLAVGAVDSPAAQQAPAQQPAEPSVTEDLGYGFGSVVANLFYMPAKITYAGLGLLTGGLGYVVTGGRADVANDIIYPSVRGNYVVTPSHLKGEQPLYFVGAPPPEDPAPAPQASMPAQSAKR